MDQLRKSAAREQWIPMLWWFVMMGVMGIALIVFTYRHSPLIAILLAAVMAAGWLAPLAATWSLALPRRAKVSIPAPGEGSFREWREQARAIGCLLIYYDENPNLPPSVRQALRGAHEEIRGVLAAHPLRDDLERACWGIWSGAIEQAKAWFWQEYRPRLHDVLERHGQAVAAGLGENERLIALQESVENAAAWMTRQCMPRMLERERLACAHDCAWLAAQAGAVHDGTVSPIELAAALVIEWGDISEPWLPHKALRRALARLAVPPPAERTVPLAPAEGAGTIVIRNGKKYRRVRVRRPRRHHHRNPNRGPSIVDIFLSFGQWIKYSVRSWMLYR